MQSLIGVWGCWFGSAAIVWLFCCGVDVLGSCCEGAVAFIYYCMLKG